MIFFTGDINLTDNAFDIGFGVGTKISKGLKPFRNIEKKAGDIWVGNFEGVSADVSDREGYQQYMFRLPPYYLSSLERLIDYYGVANNHVMEHGAEAYLQTCKKLKGVCKDIFGLKDQRSIFFEHEGKKIGITGFSLRNDQLGNEPLYWNFPKNEEIIEECRLLRDTDIKIAYVHWGVEFVDHPYYDQQRYAHWLVDIGFDLIIGMHPHVMQGFEVYKGKHIFYSLGNFVFEMPWEPTNYGLVVGLDVNNSSVNYWYVNIDKNFCPQMVEEYKVPTDWRIDTLCKKIPSNENIERYISEAHQGLKAYRKANYQYIASNILKYDFNVLGAMLMDFVKRRF